MSTPITVIAEIGENHCGDLGRARRMIAEAARAGADIAKFQSYSGADVAPDDPEREWFEDVGLSREAHHELADVCRAEGIRFLSAPFTVEWARFLVRDLGCTEVKVASSEMLNLALLDELVAAEVETVYLSTGLATLDEVRTAVARLAGTPRIVVMHCVTQYPTHDADAGLRAIEALSAALPDVEVGYSDHTLGTLAPVLAAALGATVIEKHFTLDRSLPGTDHVLSVLPPELAAMVGDLRRASAMLGRTGKAPIAAEREITALVRKRFPKPEVAVR